MWLMLQKETPDDYVIATGEAYSVRQFLEESFSHVDLDWQTYVEIDPQYFRPTEVDYLLGDPSKSLKILDWKPKTSFKTLVQMMTESDLKLALTEASFIGEKN